MCDENLIFAGIIRSSFGRNMRGSALLLAGLRCDEVDAKAQSGR